jgi:hypothetical protein
MPKQRQHYDFIVPETWDDISLNEFIEYKKLYDEYNNEPPLTKLLAFVTKKDEDYINGAPALIINKLVEKLKFLREPLPSLSTNVITIDGVTYRINTEEELKFQEFVDTQTVLQNDPSNFPALLGIICRLDNEKYGDDFIAKVLPSRIAMFENQPMTKIQPLLNFILTSLTILPYTTQQYSMALVEEVNHMLQHCENLTQSGAGRKRFTILHKIRLWRLKKSLNRILRQFSLS